MKREAVRSWVLFAALICIMLLAPAVTEAIARPIDAALTAVICA